MRSRFVFSGPTRLSALNILATAYLRARVDLRRFRRQVCRDYQGWRSRVLVLTLRVVDAVAQKYKLGDPTEPETNLGPVVSVASAERIRKQVSSASK